MTETIAAAIPNLNFSSTAIQDKINSNASIHGEFSLYAKTAQNIKAAFFITPNLLQSKLSDVQKESLDLMATELARILCGDNNEVSSWLEIAGFAQLAIEELSPKVLSSARQTNAISSGI